MNQDRTRYLILCLLLMAAFSALLPAQAAAQEIRLRRGDRLQLTVPERQEMNRQLVVGDNGSVTIPVIGDIDVQGLTLSEARDLILRRLTEIYTSIRNINLTVVGDESKRYIYVHGQVLTPGRYEFANNPNVWEAVREAGGALPTAGLETVRIIRASDSDRRTFLVNLQQVIENGNFESLPVLKPGDTVIIPEKAVQYTGNDAVRVIGAVVNPSSYKLSGDKTLVDAILAAGGPTENADLSNVRVIRHLAEGSVVTYEIDFKEYLENGDSRQNPPIHPDDTVSIPSEQNVLRVILTDPAFLLGTITAAATIIAVTTR
jgi:polysaccharide export outer membrane protein